jgi:hypothetical protein
MNAMMRSTIKIRGPAFLLASPCQDAGLASPPFHGSGLGHGTPYEHQPKVSGARPVGSLTTLKVTTFFYHVAAFRL